MLSNIKLGQMEIPKEDPFANDRLGRKEPANVLTGLVSKVPGPLVVSLNGGWGTGKTVFLKMWQQSLENERFRAIYFSAWEDDYSNDALVAMIGQIWVTLERTSYKEIAASIKECAVPLLKKTVVGTIKAVTAGSVSLDEKELQSAGKQAVDEYIAAGRMIKDLKDRLNGLASKVREETEKPLVIIVDELDRCRPTFAIELLEKIKHLFDIPGILFVLGIDREQLGHSIRAVYGQGMNVDGYLRRFIDMEFILSPGGTRPFCLHMFEQLGLNKSCNENVSRGVDSNRMCDIISRLWGCFALSLRDIEHCCRLLALAYTDTGGISPLPSYLLATLILVKLVNPDLYREYCQGRCNGGNVSDFIAAQPGAADFFNTNEGMRVQVELLMCSPDEWRDAVLEQMRLQLNEAFTKPELVPETVKNMSKDALSWVCEWCERSTDRWYGRDVLVDVSKKLELASLMLGDGRRF